MNLREKLEQNYDPSDTNKSMEIAYAVLELMRHVELALESNNANVLMGRDQANQLSARRNRLAQKLGLLDSWASAEEILDFRKSLKDS